MAEAPQGGGIADVFVQTDASLSKLAQVAAQNPNIPDSAKEALQTALEAFRSASQEILAAAKGGQQAGPVAPESGGAPGAVPFSPEGAPR